MDSIERLIGDSPPRQLVIGIAGGTGSGKTTIARDLWCRLHPLSVENVNLDRFHKPESELPTFFSAHHQKPRPDFNRPDSVRPGAMFEACRAIEGFDVLILEGIFALYFEEVRRLMRVKCYVAASLDEMLIRRTKRNMARGMDYEEIAHYNLECVTPQHLRYNAPTRKYADLIIPNDLNEEALRDAALDRLCGAIRAALCPA